jgi:glutathione S-transferase
MPPKKSKVIEGLDTHHPRSVVQFRPADWSSKLIASGLSTEPFTLHYFAIRGLGELPRLMMELAQIPYDSVMYWDSTEYKELAPFGQLPLLMGGDLDDNDMILSQSSSITRYIAKETNLDGSENGAVGEARADMVFECSKDLSANMGAIHASTDEERAKFHAMLAKTVDLLDEFEGPWFSGMCVTYGDVGMWQVLATVEELKPGYLKKHDFEVHAS